jgi:NADH-quinone oxidoreductase subunit E
LRPGQTTADGEVTLEYSECLGACEFAPCMLVNEDLHKDLSPETAYALVETWRQAT